jgi:protein-L-isoaspartate(D-aspartate) O-methyltransferase
LVQDLADRGITDKAVLDAILAVPRQIFMERAFEDQAYVDKAFPIAEGQTISQPFTVAYQTQLLRLKPRMKVLEIGTGSGYQSAILCAMGMRVFSVEIVPKLHQRAKKVLAELEYKAKLHLGDGSLGWPQYQPYDRILITAASPSIPQPLQRQLETGGRMVLPMGNRELQRMVVVTREGRNEFKVEKLQEFRFVPLRGKHGFTE